MKRYFIPFLILFFSFNSNASKVQESKRYIDIDIAKEKAMENATKWSILLLSVEGLAGLLVLYFCIKMTRPKQYEKIRSHEKIS